MKEMHSDDWGFEGGAVEEFEFSGGDILESGDFELVEGFEDEPELIKTDIEDDLLDEPSVILPEEPSTTRVEPQRDDYLEEPSPPQAPRVITPSELPRITDDEPRPQVEQASFSKDIETSSDERESEREPKAETPLAVRPSPPVREHGERETKEEQLTSILNRFLDTSPDLVGACLISMEGLMIAAALHGDTEQDKVAAMSAAILSLGERASIELGQGALRQLFVQGEHGYVFMTAVGEAAVLTTIADRHAKLGLVFYEMRRVSAELEAALA